MSDIKRRMISRPVELRENGSGQLPTITGYAAVFYKAGDDGTRYQMFHDCEERILPGAFDSALKRDDPIAKFNHEDTHILGRKSSGTLRLSADDIGLRYEIDPPNTETGREVVELIRRGDVRGSSFAFLPNGKYANPPEMRDGKPYYVCEVRDCRLFDVSPVTEPAYTGTEAGVIRGIGVDGESARNNIVSNLNAAADTDLIAVTLAAMVDES